MCSKSLLCHAILSLISFVILFFCFNIVPAGAQTFPYVATSYCGGYGSIVDELATSFNPNYYKDCMGMNAQAVELISLNVGFILNQYEARDRGIIGMRTGYINIMTCYGSIPYLPEVKKANS